MSIFKKFPFPLVVSDCGKASPVAIAPTLFSLQPDAWVLEVLQRALDTRTFALNNIVPAIQRPPATSLNYRSYSERSQLKQGDTPATSPPSSGPPVLTVSGMTRNRIRINLIDELDASAARLLQASSASKPVLT